MVFIINVLQIQPFPTFGFKPVNICLQNASTIEFNYVSVARNNIYRSPADSKVELFIINKLAYIIDLW